MHDDYSQLKEREMEPKGPATPLVSRIVHWFRLFSVNDDDDAQMENSSY